MNLPDPKQLKSLGQVLQLHEQQLELIRASLEKQSQIVNTKRRQADSLGCELAEAQTNSSPMPTANGLELASHLMQQIQEKIDAKNVEVAESVKQEELIRNELRQLMSKKEALETLIARQTLELNKHRQTREQHLADERFLNRRILS